MATLIDGRAIAAGITAKLPARVARLPRKPGLGVILVGRDPASELYVKLKGKAAHDAGIVFWLSRFDDRADAESIVKKITAWNIDPQVDAILVQLPLPNHLPEDAVVEAMDPEKDVDGFHPVNTGRFINGERTNPPGLIEGILRLIAATTRTLTGTQTTVVARDSIFTRCLTYALTRAGSRVSVTPTDGQHRAQTLQADIVIVAAGRPNLIVGEDLKPGCIVIDIGINTLPNEKIVGDVNRPSVAPVAGWLTPVPGGVGPMTIAMLLENTVRLAERNQTS